MLVGFFIEWKTKDVSYCQKVGKNNNVTQTNILISCKYIWNIIRSTKISSKSQKPTKSLLKYDPCLKNKAAVQLKEKFKSNSNLNLIKSMFGNILVLFYLKQRIKLVLRIAP